MFVKLFFFVEVFPPGILILRNAHSSQPIALPSPNARRRVRTQGFSVVVRSRGFKVRGWHRSGARRRGRTTTPSSKAGALPLWRTPFRIYVARGQEKRLALCQRCVKADSAQFTIFVRVLIRSSQCFTSKTTSLAWRP